MLPLQSAEPRPYQRPSRSVSSQTGEGQSSSPSGGWLERRGTSEAGVPLRTLGQKARDAFEVPRDLLLGRYPPFVTGGPLPRGHVPVFVLTHHPRPVLAMRGGTEFRFVTEGIHAALEQARAAARSGDVRIGGGVATIRQYLQARLIDELHLAVRPVLLGAGEPLLAGLDLRALGYE